MKVHRMTFDIAVSRDAPDVYMVQSALCDVMRKLGFVLGAEGIRNCFRVNSINASEAIEKQINESEMTK